MTDDAFEPARSSTAPGSGDDLHTEHRLENEHRAFAEYLEARAELLELTEHLAARRKPVEAPSESAATRSFDSTDNLRGIALLVENSNDGTVASPPVQAHSQLRPGRRHDRRRPPVHPRPPKRQTKLPRSIRPDGDSDEVSAPTAGDRRTVSRATVFVGLAIIQIVSIIGALTPVKMPFATAAFGLAAVVVVPAYLLFQLTPKRLSTLERVGFAMAAALLVLMLTGLAANTFLRQVGVTRPLDPLPISVAVVLSTLLLAIFAFRRHPRTLRIELELPRIAKVLLPAAIATTVLAVMGANRLNNGYGGGLQTFNLVLIAVVLCVVVWAAPWCPSWLPPAVIYCVSLALLFSTSLRGWFITGHDVQREYAMFQLTKHDGVWNAAHYRDAYNSCLSITILPTMLARFTKVFDPYVYKAEFQILFALCPVLVFAFSRRVLDTGRAVIAAVFFIGFVTFFQDMPMLNRQEIAFLFLVVALVALFARELDGVPRALWFGVGAVGMVLSHYSTTYVFVATLAGAWIGFVLLRSCSFGGLRERVRATAPRIRLVHVLAVVALAFLWSGPLTHTQDGVQRTTDAIVASLKGDASSTRSSDTGYSALGGHKESSGQRLKEYGASVEQQTQAERASGAFYPSAMVDRYPIRAVDPGNLPLTSIGKALKRVGVPVEAMDQLERQANAQLLQLLLAIGLIAAFTWRRRWHNLPPELLVLCAATMIVVAIAVVMPVVSVEYGLLRAFQQGLTVFSALLVVGCAALVPSRWIKHADAVCAAVAVGLLLSASGVMTQVTGGYPPQLHLNNSGQYYDMYYVHPQEEAGAAWLREEAPPGAVVQSEAQTDRYNFSKSASPQSLGDLNDIYPTLLRTDSYVFLGYTNVQDDRSIVSYGGDLLMYAYPVDFLDSVKNKVYSNGGASVYR